MTSQRAGSSAEVRSTPLPSQSYWDDARRPWTCFWFLLPAILVYEYGLLALGGQTSWPARSGADDWLQAGLCSIGLTWQWTPPCLVLGTLMAWHWVDGAGRRLQWRTLWGMAAESVLWACCLIATGQLWQLAMTAAPVEPLSLHRAPSPEFARFVTFLGAGIYEEFVFRLGLASSGYALLRWLQCERRTAAVTVIVASSMIFSLAHYVDGGPTFASWIGSIPEAVARLRHTPALWAGFLFRAGAGAFFAGLFRFRGFGVAAGAHSVYDIVVGIVMVPPL